jgi:cell division protein FtsQ
MPRVKPAANYYITQKRGPVLPKRALLAGGALLIALASGWGLWQSGWPQRQAANLGHAFLNLTADAGFALRKIEVTGRNHIDREALKEALQAEEGIPILRLNRQEMADNLRALGWVSEATIERRLPDTLFVRLTERVPLARWQNQGAISLIDESGEVIAGADIVEFQALPLVVGKGAPAATKDLLSLLANSPEVQPLVQAATWVGERRWDLLLENAVTARLPEDHPELALKRLTALLQDPQILNREVLAVDLRFPDRLIFERPVASAPPKTAKAAR